MNFGFRPAGAVTEFYGQLEQLSKAEEKVLVWQTNTKEERTTVYSTIKSYLASKDNTIINISLQDDTKLAQELPVFIYDESNGVLFKGSVEHQINKTVKIKAFDNVFLKENRSVRRVNFQYTKVMVDITYGKKLNFHGLRLKDISENGFSIWVNSKMAQGFKKNIEVNLDLINNIEIPIELEGMIVHKTSGEKVMGGRKEAVLIGVKFHQKSKLIKKVITVLEETS